MNRKPNPSSSPRTSPSASKKTALGSREKPALRFHENQQLVIYLFISAMIVTAWVLGALQFSFTYVFALVALVFIVWRGKVMAIVDEHIVRQETLLHRRRALQHHETSEWLNFIINRWWLFSCDNISDLIKRNLDPVLDDIKPAFVDSIELSSFSVGEQTPYVKYVQAYEYTDKVGRLKKPMSWSSVMRPPSGLNHFQQYEVVLEADVGLQCDDFKMVFTTRLGGKWMGMNLDVAVDKLYVTGKLQLVMHLDMDTPFPHISSLTILFLEKPEVWFSIRVLKAVQMMEIPLLKSWIHSVVMDGLTQALVDPGKIDIRTNSTGPTKAPAKSKVKARASAVLTVTVSEEDPKASTFIDDIRYCTLVVGDQKQYTQQTQGDALWEDTCSFLIQNLATDTLIIKSKSKILLSTYTLAQFELPLSNYPFQFKPIVDTSVEGKVLKRKGGGMIKLNLNLECTVLPSIDDFMNKPEYYRNTTNEVAGVLYVCIHGADSLLGLDRNGFSDPYCVLYSNGKKVKTTHYICRTKNPRWDARMEFIVSDFTKTMLSFIVYDWDGRDASQDDFLGSAYVILSEARLPWEEMVKLNEGSIFIITETQFAIQSQEEPCLLRKILPLGYNLFHADPTEDTNKLGSISISVVFRPVPSVANSRKPETVGQEVQSKRKKFINTAKQKLSSGPRDSLHCEQLSFDQDLLEIHIEQAKNLMAMDSNGYSDPYVEVFINKERKFTTSIKKKTLNPLWDEWVTLQLPKANEQLEISVWDRDVFFQKDFLGCLTFSLDDIKAYSKQNDHRGWFQLQRVKSGYVQLHFKVISDDLGPEESRHPASSSWETDSGVKVVDSFPQDDDTFPSFPSCYTTMSPIEEKSSDSLAAITVDNGAVDTVKRAIRTEELTMPGGDENGNKGARSEHSSMTFTPDSELQSPLRRSSSVNNVDGFMDDAGVITRGRPCSTPVSLSMPDQEKPRQRGHSVDSPGLLSLGNYYHVHGCLRRLRGLKKISGTIYCKLRLDNRSMQQRSKKSASGRLLIKSFNVAAAHNTKFNVDFEIDEGLGILKEALLIVDVKQSHKDRLATKSFTLKELFNGLHETSKWVPLENGIEVELGLSRSTSAASGDGPCKHDGRNFLSSLKRTFSSKHKAT